ncbi:hypothetical protein D9758_004796 [Tetrapyrgos nigripes]|uniref:Uncharacterized protein n=1 Tax=Tetrapyrgos nigripes TaxID=182062 RepID=A0A8H5LJ33_9AGAR|nr:hypothetical protein D9758_004796 [Tetrapyrgos nigripes]
MPRNPEHPKGRYRQNLDVTRAEFVKKNATGDLMNLADARPVFVFVCSVWDSVPNDLIGYEYAIWILLVGLITDSSDLQENKKVSDIREKIKNFLASQGMIKGPTVTEPRAAEQGQTSRRADEKYHAQSESSQSNVLVLKENLFELPASESESGGEPEAEISEGDKEYHIPPPEDLSCSKEHPVDRSHTGWEEEPGDIDDPVPPPESPLPKHDEGASTDALVINNVSGDAHYSTTNDSSTTTNSHNIHIHITSSSHNTTSSSPNDTNQGNRRSRWSVTKFIHVHVPTFLPIPYFPQGFVQWIWDAMNQRWLQSFLTPVVQWFHSATVPFPSPCYP